MGKVVPGFADARLIGNKTSEDLDRERREFAADVDRIRLALLRQLRAGTDIGELIYYAFKEAQEQVIEGCTLLDNRPGSWESGCLDQMMEQVLLGIQSERQDAAAAQVKD